MQIKYDIMYTPYTIDTYSTFTMEGAENSIIENVQEDNPTKKIDCDSIGWEYDHEGYVQALAEKWLELMHSNVLDDVIKNVSLVGKAYSPREYNFSTDNCETVFDVNMKKLQAFIEKNQKDFNENHIKSKSGFMCLMDSDQIILHYYLHKVCEEEYKPWGYMMDVLDDDQVGNGYNFIDYKLIEK